MLRSNSKHAQVVEGKKKKRTRGAATRQTRVALEVAWRREGFRHVNAPSRDSALLPNLAELQDSHELTKPRFGS